MEQNARVFISCGQRRGSDELTIAQNVASSLQSLGYIPYIALEEQTLLGVRENIFRRLDQSEYVIFIDFKREELSPGQFRGSLFSHQELAIASFLEKPVLAFREYGTKADDGVMGYIQANCEEFTDRIQLLSRVISRVKESWDPKWREELLLERSDSDWLEIKAAPDRWDPVWENERPPPRSSWSQRTLWYHIRVRNPHSSKIARGCIAFLERITNVHTHESVSPQLLPIKWGGITSVDVAIPPRQFRLLDAFHTYDFRPIVARLGVNPFLVDSSSLFQEYSRTGPGIYDLAYIVYSDDFSPARATFRLDIGLTEADLTLRAVN